MINVRPLSEGFALAYAYDPAFETERPNYADEYRRAVETLDFRPLLRNGVRASMFRFRPLTVTELRFLHDLGRPALAPWLAFRIAITGVEDCPGLDRIPKAIDPEFPSLGQMLQRTVTDQIDAAPTNYGRPAGELITDLGNALLARCASPSPL